MKKQLILLALLHLAVTRTVVAYLSTQALQIYTSLSINLQENDATFPEFCKFHFQISTELLCPSNINSNGLTDYTIDNYNCDPDTKLLTFDASDCRSQGKVVLENFYTGSYQSENINQLTIYDFIGNILLTYELKIFIGIDDMTADVAVFESQHAYSLMSATFEFTPKLTYFQQTNFKITIPFAHESPDYSHFQDQNIKIVGLSGVLPSPTFTIAGDTLIIYPYDNSYINTEYQNVKFRVEGIFSSYITETVQGINLKIMYDNFLMEKKEKMKYQTLKKAEGLQAVIEDHNQGVSQTSNLILKISSPFFVKSNTYLMISFPEDSIFKGIHNIINILLQIRPSHRSMYLPQQQSPFQLQRCQFSSTTLSSNP